MNDQESILVFMKLNGPVLPTQVAKHIKSNILLASAHLSELTSQGKVKVSNLKIGGSPIYYLPEHRSKLHSFAQHLNPKDQQTVELLKEEKILREKELELISRVSLRAVKDFAIPLNVTLDNNKELFWKWYLISDQQATDLIRTRLSVPKEPKIKTSVKQRIRQDRREKDRLPAKTKTEENIVKQEPKEPEEFKKNKRISSEQKPPISEKFVDENRNEKEELIDKPKKEKTTKNGRKKPLFQKIRDKFKQPKRVSIPDEFFPQLEKYFQERTIKIDKKENVRKNSEMNFILKVPAVVGELTYYCKAKNKKRCDEKDLSAAYLEAQTKKLPLLFLYTNELNKKAQEMLDSGNFDNLTVKKIE